MGANLVEGRSNLGEGGSDLADGTSDLAEGTSDLADGSIGLADGRRDLPDGRLGLGDGRRDPAHGTSDLGDGTSDLGDGTSDLAAGRSGLADGTSDLADGSIDLADGRSGLAEGTRHLADGSIDLADGRSGLVYGRIDLGDWSIGLVHGRSDLADGRRGLVCRRIDLADRRCGPGPVPDRHANPALRPPFTSASSCHAGSRRWRVQPIGWGPNPCRVRSLPVPRARPRRTGAMHWIAPASKDAATASLEKRLWGAVDELRANSGLTSAQYGQPVLGLIFLRFADARFAARRAELEKSATGRRGSRVDDPAAYHAGGVLFLPPEARFAGLLEYPEGGKNKKSLGRYVGIVPTEEMSDEK